MPIEFIPAICPNCNGELRIPEDRKTVKCMYCGYDIIIHETSNNQPQTSVENWMKLADSLVDSNPEEANGYYLKILEVEPENWKAWLGKTLCGQNNISRLTNNIDINKQFIFGIINNVQKANEYCPENVKYKFIEYIYPKLIILTKNYILDIEKFSKTNNYSYDDILEKSEFYFTMIDFIINFVKPIHPNYIFIAEEGLKGVRIIRQFIPIDDYFESREQQNSDKYQYYVNMIRNINPDYKIKP